jgi:hypothetical protein
MDDEHSAQPIQMKGKTIRVIPIEDQRIYVADVLLPSGEIAYYASEPIPNEDREEKWRMYASATHYLIGHRGILRDGITLAKRNGVEWFRSQLLDSNYLPPNSPYEEKFFEFFDPYISSLSQKESSEVRVSAPFEGIGSGVVGMHCGISTRINYISKKPVKGLFNFPDQNPELLNLKDYMSAYDDIIMSVSTFHTMGVDGDTFYQHRGIFRNPLSMLRRDYKGLGLSIHAFSARAWHLENPQEEIMMVDPDGNVVMKEILLKEFRDDELSSSDHPTSDEKLRQFHEKNRGGIMITIAALEERF